jgi:Xaa-Pro aminopeptidase
VVSGLSRKLNLRRLGYEERHLSHDAYLYLKKAFKGKVKLLPAQSLIEELRQTKDSDEIAKISKAVAIAIKAFKFARSLIRPGIREIEAAAELERFIRYNGAYSSSFDIIVASGPNSSYPHHVTSARRIRKDEPVLIDMGVDYQGYKSDLTRVFFSGKIDKFQASIYNIVLEAQERALNEIKPGIATRKIDTAARQHIENRGFGGFFSHSCGHGAGLEVHEKPSLSSKDNNKLSPGMVFTVEPGIYLPGRFGVRIEDMVLVTKTGCSILSGKLSR